MRTTKENYMPPKGWKKNAASPVTGAAKPAPAKKTRAKKSLDANQSKPMECAPETKKDASGGVDRYELFKTASMVRENAELVGGMLAAPNVPAELASLLIKEYADSIKDLGTLRQLLMGTPTPPEKAAAAAPESEYVTHTVETPAPGTTVTTTTSPAPFMPPPPVMGGSGFVPTLPGVPMKG